ncbi:preprotein translocase subunit SecA [Candidatus Azambacteria bacterium RIFCSPHIGHO2_01_FULL_40_24]|uniref:Protein translocase subunit SecA n=1 Tax=Candidatus Azambacteria bacterium RIFCSPHIGHO2_01_FULL_40_24 TaxID=1797301 RepID=A0A1F5B2N5_9BACT|nr:MAG: preprotein translocase subunit SecA [Candidatus Azambacteria bacterium RIFCSPHIGHO2_01_FULL_40_24]
MVGILSKIFGDANQKYLNGVKPIIEKINAFEEVFIKLSDDELKSKTEEFKKRLSSKETLDDILPEAFAAVREATKRTLKQRHFDVQLVGGIALHQGKIAQMATGEGKTLTATLPVYLNALKNSVHIVTVNDYLARRDTAWMGQIYDFLGLTVGCVNSDGNFIYDPAHLTKSEIRNPKSEINSNDQNNKLDEVRDTQGAFKVVHEFLRPVVKKDVYNCDVVYGTNTEFGFDYLRDNIVSDISQIISPERHFAIVDEVDSILIDEARTPLIISMPDAESPKLYETFSHIVPRLKENEDYNVDLKMRTAVINDAGLNKVENILGIGNIYDEKGARYVHHLETALKAQALFHKDKDYVVKNGEIIIVDEFTGRLLTGRRYSEGLHQAIEAKEGVRVQQESKTLATITFQNFFRLYDKLSGMTGTAATSAEEFHKVYKLGVVIVPTNKPMIRKTLPDRIYKTEKAKLNAIVAEVKNRYEVGQPVLIGTISIENNEKLSQLLSREGIKHEVLNAKQHEREAVIHAQAGRLKAVTVATNMAGRGVDIILGGNPPNPEEAQKVKELGGLHVIGTERHEARRIDNQLRGRSGRQGDPGSSQFFVSLEDSLLQVFGGARIKGLMETLNIPEDQPIEAGLISKALESAQTKIEGFNFDARKFVLEYDDVMNQHRILVYKKRRDILSSPLRQSSRLAEAAGEAQASEASVLRDEIIKLIKNQVENIINFHTAENDGRQWDKEEIFENLKTIFPVSDENKEFLTVNSERQKIISYYQNVAEEVYNLKEKEVGGSEIMRQIEKMIMLNILDNLWTNHLEDMEYLRDSVRLRAYGQRDPLVEYKNESQRLFKGFLLDFEARVAMTIFKVAVPRNFAAQNFETPKSTTADFSNVGRNNPCPCGSGKKYKKCHGM